MNRQALSAFLWAVADLLRGDYKHSDYGKVIRGLLVTCPPADEQESIARYLSVDIAQSDVLSADAESAIDLPKERRPTLISAAVTGRIEVRGWAASSPASSEAARD